MHRREFLSNIASYGVLGGAACSTAGCGTLLHPERCGQPHSNHIDWSVVALDGLGLLLFFVPGVVAFAVDFYTGAIYLPYGTYPAWPGHGPTPAYPPSSYPPSSYPPAGSSPPPQEYPSPPQPVEPLGLKRLPVRHDQLNQHAIEQVVTNHVGQPVSLDDSQARVSQLPRLDRFAAQRDQHHDDPKFGQSVKAFFKKLLPA